MWPLLLPLCTVAYRTSLWRSAGGLICMCVYGSLFVFIFLWGVRSLWCVWGGILWNMFRCILTRAKESAVVSHLLKYTELYEIGLWTRSISYVFESMLPKRGLCKAHCKLFTAHSLYTTLCNIGCYFWLSTWRNMTAIIVMGLIKM